MNQFNKKISIKEWLLNGLTFLLCIGITFFIILSKTSPKDLYESFKDVGRTYIILGSIFIIIYSFIEACSMKILLQALNIKKSLLDCFKYAIIGFFFSGISPSSTGGQPMQMLYMSKDNIPFSHSSISLFCLLLCYQLVIGIYGAIGYIIGFPYFFDTLDSLNFWFYIAMLINLIIIIFFGGLIFYWPLTQKIITLIGKVFYKINANLGNKVNKKLNIFVEKYKDCSKYLSANKIVVLKVLGNTFIQFLFLFSIPFLVYKGFGYTGFPLVAIILSQAVLQVMSGFVPLPGALIVAESLFLVVFQKWFFANDIGKASIISRSMSLYFPLIVYGAFTALFIKDLFINKSK